jgi:hypothetical protein
MSQTPMAGDLCLGHLCLETYVPDPYGGRSMSQTPMPETYVSDTYGWRPMHRSQA